MNFPARPIQLRKAAVLMQQALAKVLHVSLDERVFEEHERGPSDDWALQFEAISGMPEEERHIIKALMDGMILKYQAKQITERG